ncbi:hypothetical protein OA50_05267 [Mameliella alba]|uniref:Uncharacterized protein n=1 Tax=Mameliella alba TaxID=561184 RepID=A0A0B3RTQ0_9RHOB|nr:hypothetical protein OA50_05267 [Mameliella alba]
MVRLGYQLVTGKEAVNPVAPYPSQLTEMY